MAHAHFRNVLETIPHATLYTTLVPKQQSHMKQLTNCMLPDLPVLTACKQSKLEGLGTRLVQNRSINHYLSFYDTTLLLSSIVEFLWLSTSSKVRKLQVQSTHKEAALVRPALQRNISQPERPLVNPYQLIQPDTRERILKFYVRDRFFRHFWEKESCLRLRHSDSVTFLILGSKVSLRLMRC